MKSHDCNHLVSIFPLVHPRSGCQKEALFWESNSTFRHTGSRSSSIPYKNEYSSAKCKVAHMYVGTFLPIYCTAATAVGVSTCTNISTVQKNIKIGCLSNTYMYVGDSSMPIIPTHPEGIIGQHTIVTNCQHSSHARD